MKEDIAIFLDVAIELERNLARLYGVFAKHINEDFDFWTKLEAEEKNHASLLETGKSFLEFDRFPHTLLPGSAEEVKESSIRIHEVIDEFEKKPDRTYAFEQALKFEKSAGEMHYQFFMDGESEDKLVKLFQNLNRQDIDHAERIFMYWQQAQ